MVSLDRKGHVEYEGFLTEEESLFVASILRRDESKILGIPNSYPKTIYTGLTHQFNVYNFLTHPDIRILNIPDRIFNLPLFEPRKDNWYDELWVQCWGNVLHQGQEIKEHAHEYPEDPNRKIYACSIYLDGADPSYTHWEEGKQQNTRGTLHIVGREHKHHVKRNIHTTPRISLAFDIWEEDPNYKDDTKRFLHIRRDTQRSSDRLRRERNESDRRNLHGHGVVTDNDMKKLQEIYDKQYPDINDTFQEQVF